MRKWTEIQIEDHLRTNAKDYSAAVVISALYKRLYGVLPKIGLSGQQAEFAKFVYDRLPTKITFDRRKQCLRKSA